MTRLKNMNPAEAQLALVGACCRAMHFSPAAAGLFSLLCDMDSGERGALGGYHALTQSLLSSPARRVSGDIWRDALLYELIETEHLFALAAARGERDRAQLMAMGELLGVLGLISEVTPELIARLIAERGRLARSRDSVAMKSTAIWSGGSIANLPKAEPAEEPQLKIELTPWKYGEPGLTGSYISDEALEEMYHRFLESGSWSGLTEDLWNFFASYGTGPFLKDRLFRLHRGELLPIHEPDGIIPLTALEEPHAALLERTIKFMRGEKAENALITGGAGTGKTAQLLSLLNELPEVRMVILNDGDTDGVTELVSRLSAQPLKFILALDGVEPEGTAMKAVSDATAGFAVQPRNVLIYAASRSDGGVLPGRVNLSYLNLKQFTGMVGEIMEYDGFEPDPQEVHNAALDHQVDVRERLTVAGAVSVARSLEK